MGAGLADPRTGRTLHVRLRWSPDRVSSYFQNSRQMPSLVRYAIAGHRNRFGRRSYDVADLVRGCRPSCMCTSRLLQEDCRPMAASHNFRCAHVEFVECFSSCVQRRIRRRAVCAIRLQHCEDSGPNQRLDRMMSSGKICMNLSFDRLPISTLDA